MIYTLDDLVDRLRASRVNPIAQTVTTFGSYSAGEPPWKTRIEVVAEPAATCSVVAALEEEPHTLHRTYRHTQNELEAFLKAAGLGVLESLILSGPPFVIPGCSVRITGVLPLDISSHEAGFRLAGRDAGAKIVTSLARQAGGERALEPRHQARSPKTFE